MEKLNIPINDILPILDEYYNSIKKVFAKTLKIKTPKGYDKITFRFFVPGLFLMLYMFMFFFSIVPVVPGIVYLTLNKNLSQVDFDSLPLFLNNFFVIWILMILLTLPARKIFNWYEKKENEKISKSTLDISVYSFCFLYVTIKEIETYLINSRKEHLDNAKANIVNYYNVSDFQVGIKALPAYRQSSRINFQIFDLIDFIKLKYSWIILSESSEQIIKGLSETNTKIIERIRQGTELNQVLTPLKLLLIFEFSKIGKIPDKILNNYNIQNSHFQELCLLYYSNLLSNLTMIEDKKLFENVVKFNIFFRVFLNFRNSLSSDQVVKCFFSWYFMLQILCSILFVFCIYLLKINIDTTIIVALITIPILGAAQIANNLRHQKNIQKL